MEHTISRAIAPALLILIALSGACGGDDSPTGDTNKVTSSGTPTTTTGTVTGTSSSTIGTGLAILAGAALTEVDVRNKGHYEPTNKAAVAALRAAAPATCNILADY